MAAISQLEYPQVRWDLSALFHSIDDPKIEQTLEWADAAAQSFAAKYRGKLSSPDLDEETLLGAIKEIESISNELSKPLNYSQLLFTTDTGNPKYGAFLQKMQERASDIQVKLMFFELELQAANSEAIERLMSSQKLANYRH